jgi:GMP synthase-like glutamine amidotransferase
VRISDELAASPPRGLWPEPRVGETGTYPIAATATSDPLVQAMKGLPLVASSHMDMVVDTRGFSLVYQDDGSRSPSTTAPGQAKVRCRVQAMKLDDPRRILYSSQFHPEMAEFAGSTEDDQGFGSAWLRAFLALSRRWWDEHDLPPRPQPAPP